MISRKVILSRACLDHHLIAIRSPGIQGDHVRSGTSLIAITLHCWFQSSAKLTFSNCDWLQQCFRTLHGRPGGWELSQHQQPVVRCKGRSRGAWVRGAAVGSCGD